MPAGISGGVKERKFDHISLDYTCCVHPRLEMTTPTTHCRSDKTEIIDIFQRDKLAYVHIYLEFWWYHNSCSNFLSRGHIIPLELMKTTSRYELLPFNSCINNPYDNELGHTYGT